MNVNGWPRFPPQFIVEHAFAGPGWEHPLTGVDHMVAMLAVGSWSALVGGRSIWTVPASFVTAMAVGATAGMSGLSVPGVELMIALSVLLLGTAIAVHSTHRPIAGAAAVATFGFCHGVSHGTAYNSTGGHLSYLVGIIGTTACLHLIGVVGTLLILDGPRGSTTMRVIGAAAAVTGVILVIRAPL